MDSMEVPDLDASQRAGSLAFDLLWRFADWLLESQSSFILEGNFTSRATTALEHVRDRSHLVQVICACPDAVAGDRYAERARSPARHPGHHDALRMERGHRPSVEFGPFELGAPTIVIDTSHGYEPSLEEINRFIRSAPVRTA